MTAFYSTTAKYALRYLLGSSGRRDVDAGFQALAEDVEDALTAEILFPGAIIWTARATSPSGYWLLCNGASLLRTGLYAPLFAAIGTTYGSADGTHFNVPDLRGRVMVHPDGTANRLTANDLLGNSGGEEKHAMTVGETAMHNHVMRQQTGIGGGISIGAPGATGRVSFNGADPIDGPGETENAGSGTAHNTMQPFIVLNALIHI